MSKLPLDFLTIDHESIADQNQQVSDEASKLETSGLTILFVYKEYIIVLNTKLILKAC